MAASKGHLKMLRYLIEKHPEMVNKQSRDGVTAAMLACIAGNIEVLQLLVEEGKASGTSQAGHCR